MAYDKQKARSEYAQKLRDPRWQKMRLKVMERDEFTCQHCFDTESTLNVHHKDYERGKDPWDYPEDWLETLCENCHQEETEFRAGEEKSLLNILRVKGYSFSELNEILTAFHDGPKLYGPLLSAICWAITDERQISNIYDHCREHFREKPAQ